MREMFSSDSPVRKLIDGFKDFQKNWLGTRPELLDKLIRHGQSPEALIISCSGSPGNPLYTPTFRTFLRVTNNGRAHASNLKTVQYIRFSDLDGVCPFIPGRTG
jgi:hypothetical protein